MSVLDQPCEWHPVWNSPYSICEKPSEGTVSVQQIWWLSVHADFCTRLQKYHDPSWQCWPHHQFVIAEIDSSRYICTKTMISERKKRAMSVVAYFSLKNRDWDSILGIPVTERAHSASLWHSSPINVSFLGLSKFITSFALCTSISSSLHTGTAILSALSDAIHQTCNRDTSCFQVFPLHSF